MRASIGGRRGSRLGRAARMLAWVVATPLLLLALAVPSLVLYARSEVGRAQLRSLVLAQARARVPGLDLGRIDGGYLHDLVLRDVGVRDREGRPAVQVDVVSLRFDLLALWHRTVAVRTMQMQGVHVLVRPEADGSLNIDHLMTPPSAGAPRPPSPSSSPPAANRWNIHIDRLAINDLRADVQLDPATPPLVADGDISARLALDGERLSARIDQGEVLTERGRLTVDGSATVDGVTAPRPHLTDYQLVLSVKDVDPARWSAAAPAGRLGLTVAAHGAGTPLEDGSEAAAEIHLVPSEIAGVAIAAGQVQATLEGTHWQIASASVQGPGFGASLSGHGDGRLVWLELKASLQGRLPGPPGSVPDVRGRGTLTARVAGTLPDVDVTADGDVVGLRAGQRRIGGAVLHVQVQHPLSAPRGSLRLAARAVTVSPQAPRVDRLILSASGDGHRLRVDGAVVGPRLRGGLRARGTLSAGDADVQVQALSLDFATAGYRQVLALRQPAQVRWRADSGIDWKNVVVHGDGFRLTGDAVTSGHYRLSPPSGNQPLAGVELELHQASFNGLSPVNAAVTASLLPRRADLRLTAEMQSAGAQLQLDAELPVVVPSGGQPRLASRGPVRVSVHSNEVHLESIPLVETALRRQGVSGGVATVNATVGGDVAHPDLNVIFALRDVMYRNIGGHGRDSRLKTVPGLGGSLTIQTVPQAISVGAVLRIRDAGVLTVDARTPLDVRQVMAGTTDLRQAPVQATITVPAFALASLAEFTDELKGVSGQLSGQGQVTGTFSRPSGAVSLQIAGGKVDDLDFGQVSLAGHASDGRVDATLVVRDQTGGVLNGWALLDRRHGDRLQATVEAHALNLRFVRLFAPNLRETAGVGQLTASASGTLAAPVVNAALTVENGRVGVIGQPTFRDVRLAATVRPGRADLTRLEAHSGSGSMSGSGWVSLDGLAPRRAVFKLHAHRFLVAAAGSTGALLDGDIAADAVLRRDLLTGRARIPEAQIWLPKGPSAGSTRDLQKIAEHDDVRFVDQTALAAADRQRSEAAAARPTVLDIGVVTGPIYLRGKDLDIQLDSTLKVATVASGPRAGAPTVSGGIHVRHGRINIQSQRFDFARGEITFDGSPDINPRLDIILERQYPDARVQVALRGTPKKPDLRMTSDPPVYDQAQIVSLILTGQPGGQPSSGRAFDPTAAVATAVLSKLADKLAPEVGLDVLRVEKVDQRNEEGEATGDTNTRVEVGKYVSDRIYLSYAHVFAAPDTANQNEAHVEYRLTRRWIVETIFGDAGVGGADALWTLRY